MKLLVEMDGAEHQAHRLLLSKWFLPASIRRLDESISARADEAVQALTSLGGECDFARDIAVHYPLRVIMSLFGNPDADYDSMLTPTQALMEAQDPASADQASATMLDSSRTLSDSRVAGKNPSGGAAEAILRNIVGQLVQDIPIWESKAYYEHPMLTSGDGPIMPFRRWARQFYDDWVSRRSQD